jgi:hypothetical protein
MTDEEADKLGDLTNYSFQQLKEMAEKSKSATRRPQPKLSQIMILARKVAEINKYLKKGYRIDKKEFSNKHVLLDPLEIQ